MRQSDRVRLHFGPYRTPRYKLGQSVQCEARGDVTIVGATAARFPWPIGKRGVGRSFVLYRDLVKAVKRESPVAIMYWWGLGRSVIQKWRRLLGVPATNEGTSRLRSTYALGKLGREARAKSMKVMGGPAWSAKIAAAMQEYTPSREAVAKMTSANKGRKQTALHRQRIGEAQRRCGNRPPNIGPAWSAEEDALLRSLPPVEVAAKTRRTLGAVYARRRKVGIGVPRKKVCR